ncbi:MAG TPA: hypothetical protein DFS52_19025 [Myxococcales bacterium]|nr:hypothetical protein [Myxococcales bacterium]
MAEPTPEPRRSAGAYESKRAFLLKRLLPLLLLGALAAWFFGSAPQSVELVYDLSDRSQGLRTLQVDIFELPERQIVRHAEYRYAEGAAPAEQSQSVKLKRGERYLIEARLGYADRTETVTRELTFQRESRITVRL